jgi:hypothetical protein
MITLVRPILFAFLQSQAVKKLILDLVKALVEKTDNEIDNQLYLMLERAMLNQKA